MVPPFLPPLRVLGFILLVAAGLRSGPLGAEPAADVREGLALFETHIRPTLLSECIECHGPEKQKAGLRLDSRPGWQKGGESGPALVPRQPEQSLLLRSIRHADPDLKMPEKRPKLEADLIARFERWIALGAPDPRDTPPAPNAQGVAWTDLLASRRNWWSLQPVRTVSPPALPGNAHPVDAFLNAAMEREKIEASPSASAEALVRRLHFILTGLPPSPEEVRSFVEAEHSTNRQTAVRARAAELSLSTAFAEHWARHWMDLVRYAESHGSEGDPSLPNAHHYRDYLIRAFQNDIPLDRLIVEHLAGDLVPVPRISAEGLVESRIGPAHLRMVEHGYRPVDTLDEHMKVLDNQIDVVFKAFQALTLNCARCHDHKFDAVSQRDYTAVRGVFSSIRPAQILANSEDHSGAARKDEFRALKENIRSALAGVWEQESEQIPAKLAALARPVARPDLDALREKLTGLERDIGMRLWKQIGLNGKQPPVIPYALWTFDEGPHDILGRIQGELVGGAQVRDGALHLDGSQSHLRSQPLSTSFRERTFEAWVVPSTLDQRAGGVFGIEHSNGRVFDSLVFAEKSPRKWLPGSDNFRRTLQPEGSEETEANTTPVHLALTYALDGSIQLFRNGASYGAAYRKDSLQEYPAGNARILMGLRHTGAGNGFFRGRIEEARLYDRALSPAEIAESHSSGPVRVAVEKTTGARSEDPGLAALRTEAASLRAELARLKAVNEKTDQARKPEAEEHPLHAAMRASSSPESAPFQHFLEAYLPRMRNRIADNRQFNASTFPNVWDLGSDTAPRWFGTGPDVEKIRCGDFRVRMHGETALDALLPTGWAGSMLLPQAGGILTSPEFILQNRAVHVRFFSRNGCSIRIVPDSYPLGTVGAPTATLQSATPGWVRMNAAYRVGASVYLECATPEHLPNGGGGPAKGTPAEELAEGAHFLIQKVIFSEDTPESPKPELWGLEEVLKEAPAADPSAFLQHVIGRVRSAIGAWKTGTLSEGGRELLQACIEKELLSSRSAASPALEQAVQAYRKAAATLDKPLSVPGVVEHEGRHARLLTRGDPKKAGEEVPRGFLEVIHAKPFESKQSGRMELALQLVDPHNPLTARVMVNRIWHWVFGNGIVPTVDDFGRMGEKPAHPELLDFLAARLMQSGWSARQMILWLVETDAFQRSVTPSDSARDRDPANALLSHASVRRLEAEEIRDCMLAVSGTLQREPFGAPVDVGVPRRSLYVRHRRAGLPPLFAAFDAPRPFTTLGRRSVTTVPAQSLLLLNDPSILKLAAAWGERSQRAQAPLEVQIDGMFETAFGRKATPAERDRAAVLARENGLPAVAHALFNAKEFIYLR